MLKKTADTNKNKKSEQLVCYILTLHISNDTFWFVSHTQLIIFTDNVLPVIMFLIQSSGNCRDRITELNLQTGSITFVNGSLRAIL